MLPNYMKKQIEKLLMSAILGAIEKLVAMTPEQQQTALEELREQARTGISKPGALIVFNL